MPEVTRQRKQDACKAVSYVDDRTGLLFIEIGCGLLGVSQRSLGELSDEQTTLREVQINRGTTRRTILIEVAEIHAASDGFTQ
ncbi:hypothetical protein D3C80_1994590 [compost metagenome]